MEGKFCDDYQHIMIPKKGTNFEVCENCGRYVVVTLNLENTINYTTGSGSEVKLKESGK